MHHVAGPAVALGELDALAAELDGYHLYHAVRGHVLVELGRREQARASELRALTLTANRAEQSLLRRRLGAAETARGLAQPRPPSGSRDQS